MWVVPARDFSRLANRSYVSRGRVQLLFRAGRTGKWLSMKSIRLSLVLGSWRLSGVYPARLQPEGASRESQQSARYEKPPKGRSKAVSCSGARGQAELKQHEGLSEARALR